MQAKSVPKKAICGRQWPLCSGCRCKCVFRFLISDLSTCEAGWEEVQPALSFPILSCYSYMWLLWITGLPFHDENAPSTCNQVADEEASSESSLPGRSRSFLLKLWIRVKTKARTTAKNQSKWQLDGPNMWPYFDLISNKKDVSSLKPCCFGASPFPGESSIVVDVLSLPATMNWSMCLWSIQALCPWSPQSHHLCQLVIQCLKSIQHSESGHNQQFTIDICLSRSCRTCELVWIHQWSLSSTRWESACFERVS